ncbi:hypothetical protein KBB17_00200 [Candidatus Saccharibacteria bacterium]|jgi:hypothetical protein|nr:hypothetical protein [Candidatus Saccharibacteria bacterium]MBP9131706.1 hypothetical protein [Candidatus Saccharibacteria bacterium]
MEKTAKYLVLTFATIVGSYLPVLFGASSLGMLSIVGGFFGGLAGVYIVYKMD